MMKRVLLLLLVCLLPMPLLAGTGIDRMQEFFNEITTIRADFTQVVVGPRNKTLQETTGSMLISRPGRFRWDYQKPYQQLIIADGQKVWLYDADLEQVTVRKMDTALGNTPALLLSSDTNIEENFSVKELGMEHNLAWVELTPKNTEGGFERLVLGFDEQNLRQMELQDAFGQLTRLTFSKIERNPVLDPGLFEFVPPQGVDVIGE